MKDIEIYPSSWYYNACVQGFLEVLGWGLGDKGERFIEDQILQNDGRAVIPGELAKVIFSSDSAPMLPEYIERPVPAELKGMKRISWWWVDASYQAGFIKNDDIGKELSPLEKIETVTRSLFHKYAYYPNLLQAKWETIKKIDFLNQWFNLVDEKSPERITCSFCGKPFLPDVDARIYDIFFTMSLSKTLGSSPGEFPNMFWDGNLNLPVCPLCRSFFLCFHFVNQIGFFINSDSLQINWFLNKLLSKKTRRDALTHQIALLDALQYDQQIRKSLSSWGLQHLEILIFDREKINYYPISPQVAKMLLVPQISSLLTKISNSTVWDLILRENYNYILNVVYKSLRAYLMSQNLNDDPEVIYAKENAQPITDLIDLYNEIKRNLDKEIGGKTMYSVNVRELRNSASEAPFTMSDSLAFRLLELTRLNKKGDVYHLLLRCYIANNAKFPDELVKLFTVQNDDLFKIGIYSFISGLKSTTYQ